MTPIENWDLFRGGAAAVGVALVIGGFVLWKLRESRALRTAALFADLGIADTALPRVISHLERSLYLGALIAGFPAFIGIWLVFKVVGTAEWIPVRNGSHRRASPRIVFQRTAILTGASIAWAAAGWGTFEAITRHHHMWLRAVATLAALMLVLLFLLDIRPQESGWRAVRRWAKVVADLKLPPTGSQEESEQPRPLVSTAVVVGCSVDRSLPIWLSPPSSPGRVPLPPVLRRDKAAAG